MMWSRWSGWWTAAGVVWLPIVVLWVVGRSPLAFLAWPLRYLWGWGPARHVARSGLVPAPHAAAVLLAFAALTGVTVWLDLLGWVRAPQAVFFFLEAWQLPVYYWIDLLPRGSWGGRPDYLWLLASWTLVEAGLVFVWLRRAESDR